MRTLLDTSALFAALIDSHEFHHRALPWLRTAQRQEIHGIVSTHTLAELYARMSGRVRPMMTADQVLELISRNILPFFETVSLNQDDYVAVLERLAGLDIRGATIYDGIIVQAAIKANAEQIVTFNERHFARVSAGLHLQIIVP